MFAFLNHLAAMLTFLGRFRKRWLWLPTLILGIILFWVFLAWNRIPSFGDSIEIIPICDTDNCSVAVSVQHPYFTFNNFSEDFFGFWTDYGASTAGVNFSIGHDSLPNPETGSCDSCKTTRLNAEIQDLFPKHRLDSIGTIFEFRVRKELFGNMNSRNARNKLINAWDDSGFSIVKRIAIYDQSICIDSLKVLTGVNKSTSSRVHAGYHGTMYYTLMRLFRMEDISQFNYSLSLRGNTSYIKRLEVDFGGPVEIKGLWPTPDVVEPSRIVYQSEEKISEIKNSGSIKMFCQSLESVNIQNVRLFILTTLASLCLAYTLRETGVFVLFCCRWLKRKWEKEKTNIEKAFEKKKINLQNLRKKLMDAIQNKP